MAHKRKSDIRSNRTRRKRRTPVKKSEVPVRVPLRVRAAFANYLLHGLTPDQARQRVAAEIADMQECL